MPHVVCYPSDCPAGAEQRDEANQHDYTQGIGRGAAGAVSQRGVSDRIKILDEFVALTCYHRKHAIRVLREEISPATAMRARNRVYDEAVGRH